MSNFIQRQVSRAVGQLGPEIRPRLPSLFEPMRPEAAELEPLALEAELRVPGAPELAPMPRHRIQGPARAREATDGALEGERAEVRTGSMDAPDMPGSQSVPPDPPTLPEPDAQPPLPRPPGARAVFSERRARKGAAPPAPAETASATDPAESAAGAEVVPARAAVALRAIQAIRIQAPLASAERGGRAVSRGQDSSHRRPSATMRAWSAETPEAAPLLVPPAMPASARLHPRRPSSDLPARDSAADAAIEVTIGRIEVRAAPAPSTRAPRSPAPRSPSDLERYLRQKGAGRS